MPSYSPGHIAGWVAGATLPYSLLPPKGPSNPGSLAPEGRSKTGGSSVADTRVVTYPCHGARDGILEVIARRRCVVPTILCTTLASTMLRCLPLIIPL